MIDKATHEVELNFYYLHHNDCKKFVELAKNEQSKLKSFYVRHAILSAVFASEALINRVINDFYLPGEGSASIERLNTFEKWYTAPLLCGKTKTSGHTFDSSKQPFQDFVELFKIRNWLVHPKVGAYVSAWIDNNSSITILEGSKDVPWVETLKGKIWGITRIPFNPFEFESNHAQKALDIIDAMVKELKQLIPDSVTDEWLLEIGIREKGSKGDDKITIESLWGGYTPE